MDEPESRELTALAEDTGSVLSSLRQLKPPQHTLNMLPACASPTHTGPISCRALYTWTGKDPGEH